MGLLREVRFLDHGDQRFADVDRRDTLGAFGERIVEGLHGEARRDSGHTLGLGLGAQLVDVDPPGAAFLDHLLTVVELELGHEIAAVGGRQAGQDREHRRDLEGVRGDVGAEARGLEQLLVDLDLLGEPQVVGHLDGDDAVENRFVGGVGPEFLPLGLVGVGDDHRIHIDSTVAPGSRDELFLRCGDDGVQVLDLVLEDLDELDHAAVAHVEGAVQLEHPGIAFGIAVELGDILRADQHRGILVVGIDRGHDGQAAARRLGIGDGLDRHFLVTVAEFRLEPKVTDRAEIAFDGDVQHLLEFPPQVARDQVQRLLVHGAAVDGVEGRGMLEATAQRHYQRGFAGADRAEQIEHLAVFLALQRRGVQVAHQLRDRPFYAEELVLEEVVDLQGLVAKQAFDGGVVAGLQVFPTGLGDDVVEPRMGQLGKARILLKFLQILQKRPGPMPVPPGLPVRFDQIGDR